MVAKYGLDSKGEKIKALESCYGEVALTEDKQISIQDGEIVTAWMVEGFSTFKELIDTYGMDAVLSAYDSGR